MSAEYREKLLSLGFQGQRTDTKRVPVISDKDGQPCGYQVHHADGRVDAVAQRFDVTRNPGLKVDKAEARAQFGLKD